MALPGKKPLPTALKEARGTLRPDRSNPDEPAGQPLQSVPPPPESFTPHMVEAYEAVTSWLLGVGLLEMVNLAFVQAYAHQMGKFWDLQALIGEKETVLITNGLVVPNPLSARADKCLMNALKIATEFGYTPAARTRVKTQPKRESRLMQLMKKKAQA